MNPSSIGILINSVNYLDFKNWDDPKVNKSYVVARAGNLLVHPDYNKEGHILRYYILIYIIVFNVLLSQ